MNCYDYLKNKIEIYKKQNLTSIELVKGRLDKYSDDELTATIQKLIREGYFVADKTVSYSFYNDDLLGATKTDYLYIEWD